MRIFPTAALLLIAVSLASPQSPPPSPIVSIFTAADGSTQVLTQSGSTAIPPEPGQVDIDAVKTAFDSHTAGWFVLYRNPDGGTPLSGKLVIWRDGKILRAFSADGVFWGWAFAPDGKNVAFHTGPTHGETKSHCELRDMTTGKLIASWDGDLDGPDRPNWTMALDHY